MTAKKAVRTCIDCGAVRIVSGYRPIARLCRHCDGLRKIVLMHAVNRERASRKSPQPRPIDPYIVDALVSGMPEHATPAERIAAIRRMPGLSANQLAEKLGVTARSVVRYRARMRAS